MKIKLDANLQFGRGNVFMKGVYEGDIPKELIAEMKSGSRHISEIDIPNIKSGPTKAEIAKAKKAATVKKSKETKAANARKKAEAANKAKKQPAGETAGDGPADNKGKAGGRPGPTPNPSKPKK